MSRGGGKHERMTETLVGERAGTVTVRPYRPTDHRACRQLWAELTEEHDERYEDVGQRWSDPGALFEEYLTRLDLAGMWVADDEAAGVIGFVGLILDGRVGEVAPVVVTAARRGEGIGRALLEYVAGQARKRGLRRLKISPPTRNVEAIRCLHAAGYDVLGSVTLTMELAGPNHEWRDGVDLHDVRFRY
jgi:GNAT superfamily N-acetyltransferase